MKTVKPDDLSFPPDWVFELGDGRRVTGKEFSDRFIQIPGRYPIYKKGRKIGTLTNHGPIEDLRIISRGRKFGI